MQLRLNPRFDHGQTAPWINVNGQTTSAGAGPEALQLHADVPVKAREYALEAEFNLRAGERASLMLAWRASWESPPPPVSANEAVARTEDGWRDWSGRSTYRGAWAAEVERSLIPLKAMTYQPTGGIVAAVTTSLPAFLGGVRNWGYLWQFTVFRDPIVAALE